jgi:hypothetical protein
MDEEEVGEVGEGVVGVGMVMMVLSMVSMVSMIDDRWSTYPNTTPTRHCENASLSLSSS